MTYFYQFRVKNEGAWNQFYHAEVIGMTINKSTGESIYETVREMSTESKELVSKFLVYNGVLKGEVDYAHDIMEEKGHNLAEFGFLGGFTCSRFVGKTQ